MLPGKKYTPQDLLVIGWRYRWIIVLPVFVCAFGALLYSRFSPNRYQSDTLIRLIPQQVPTTLVPAASATRIEDRLRSMSSQIMSRTRLEKIITDLNLYAEARQAGLMEDIVTLMRHDIEVEPIGKNDVVEAFRVRFSSSNPETARQVTDRLASLFIEENSRDRAATATETDRFLQAQLSKAEAELAAQERKVKEFRERHGGSLPDQGPANMQAVQTTQFQLQNTIEAVARLRDSQLTYQRLLNDLEAEINSAARAPQPTAQPPAGTPLDPTATAGATAAQQLAHARANLAQAELRLRPDHPDIRGLKRQIRDLEKKVEAEGKVSTGPPAPSTPEDESRRTRAREYRATIESLGRQIAFKETEERALRSQLGQYQARIEAVPHLETEMTTLTRGYDTLKLQYEDLLKKAQQSQLASKLTENPVIGEQFRIVDPARLPQRPISPDRLRINVVGVVVGLFLGLALAGLLEYRDTTFRNDGEVVEILTLPVLACVPYVATTAERKLGRRRRMMTVAAGAVVLLVCGGAFWNLRLWNYVL
jgi:succinoglycan biosynthesis transport protein ExoP